jgi:hypothetical protein
MKELNRTMYFRIKIDIRQGFKSPPTGDLGVKKTNNKLAFFLLFAVLIILPSCHPNRLKTSEKELAKEIRIQEKEVKEAESIALEKQKSDKLANSHSGIRYKEDRSVDPQKLPIHIDLPGTGNNTRKFRLSDVASSVRYLKLEVPNDTILLYDPFYYHSGLISSVRSDGERIIFQGLFGLTSFDLNGAYQETIWKNETGINIQRNIVGFMEQEFIGILPQIRASLLNGNIYFDFNAGPSGIGLVLRYKADSNKELFDQSKVEITEQKLILGDTLFSFQRYSSERFSAIYGTGNNTWAGINSKWNSGKTGSLLVSYNNEGDTLCNFTDYDRIVNFGSGPYRTPVELVSYYYKELLTILPEYNDTIFRMIPPNRLLPVYIIDFGEFKVKFMDGLNPDKDLSEKYLLKSLDETNDYLFIRYTKNVDASNTRRKNAVKFYNALFDKEKGILFHQPGFTLLPEGIINNLDGGMPFWPEFITPKGEMMKLVSGKNIKDYLNSESFTKGPATSDQRRKQVSLANGLKDRDMIIIIVK